MSYHITGVISSAIFLLTIVGLWAQLVLIWKRRKNESLATEQSTAVMSVNQFVSSFLAFFSFFLYGACLDPFNHYLVWPRLIAAILTLAVLVEIFRDRRDLSATMGVVSCFVMLAGSSLALVVIPGAIRPSVSGAGPIASGNSAATSRKNNSAPSVSPPWRTARRNSRAITAFMPATAPARPAAAAAHASPPPHKIGRAHV